MSDIQSKFSERVNELWEEHQEEFMAVLEDAESRKVNLTFTAALDFSESTAKLETQIRFSQVVKDRKSDDFDDPNQPPLPFPEKGGEDEEKPKRKRGKKRSDDIPATEEADA